MKLVTGGSGFFGRHLCRRLREKGEDVRVLDLKEPEADVEFVKGDVRNFSRVEKCFRKVDTVFHLASLLPQSGTTENEVYSVNCSGTENVLRAALRRNARVIHVSSSSVFGVPKKVPYSEDDEKNPIGSYGKSKLDAEKLCMRYCGKGLDATVLRPMTLVGPGIYGVFRMCLDFIKKSYPIPVLGDGENRLQFLSVHDAADACVLAERKRASGEIFNIGSDNVPTLNKMLGSVIKAAGSESKLVHLNSTVFRSAFIALRKLHLSPLVPEHYYLMDKDFILDTKKAKKLLSWKPEYGNIEMILEAYKAL